MIELTEYEKQNLEMVADWAEYQSMPAQLYGIDADENGRRQQAKEDRLRELNQKWLSKGRLFTNPQGY